MSPMFFQFFKIIFFASTAMSNLFSLFRADLATASIHPSYTSKWLGDAGPNPSSQSGTKAIVETWKLCLMSRRINKRNSLVQKFSDSHPILTIRWRRQQKTYGNVLKKVVCMSLVQRLGQYWCIEGSNRCQLWTILKKQEKLWTTWISYN